MSDNDEFYESVNKYVETMEDAIRIVRDPFKAPEQVVGTSKTVLEAIWNMQVAYAVSLRDKK